MASELPNFEISSSQTSDLGEEDLQNIELSVQAKNTRKATDWGLKKFHKWCEKRDLSIDLKTVSAEVLNETLRKFYAEVKTEKGKPLTPSALTGIRAAIHRHLTSAPLSRSINILQDSVFMSANKMFEAKGKLYTKEQNVKPQHKNAIESGDMERLNNYFLRGQTDGVWKDPEILVEFVWFSLCYHFARRGREGWRELTKMSFEFKFDDTGARYVTETQTEQTKNHQGGVKQSDQLYSDVRMYETSNALDPVSALEFYLTKVHPDCQALFQTPNKKFKSEAGNWFRNEPLGKNTISKIMERLSVKAELSQRYTNHCVRASVVTSLYQRGVDTKKICAITKHKDERSLTHYINSTTSAQKRECSRLLTEAFQGNTKELENTASNTDLVPIASTSNPYPVSQQNQLNNQSLQLTQFTQPYQNVQIQTMNVNIYQGKDNTSRKRHRRVIESDSDSE